MVARREPVIPSSGWFRGPGGDAVSRVGRDAGHAISWARTRGTTPENGKPVSGEREC
jgi:hypothetical protein